MRAPTPTKVELVRRGIRQTDFARRIGRHPVWLNRVLNGEETPGPKTRKLISDELGLAEEILFPGQVR